MAVTFDNEFIEMERELLDIHNIYVEMDEVLFAALEEYDAILKKLSTSECESIIKMCKDLVLSNLAVKFGVDALISKNDKDGGNVTTIHNAQKKIYAQKSDEYDRTTYEKGRYIPGENGKKGSWEGNSEGMTFSGSGKKSVGSQFTRSQMDENGFVIDALTGKRVKADTTSPDHIISLSKFHKDGGYMLSDKRKCDFGTDTDNLAVIDRSINYSLRDQEKSEWADSCSGGRSVSNAEHFGIDKDKMDALRAKGATAAKKHLPTTRDKVVYYTKNVVRTGTGEGIQTAFHSAVGQISSEIISAVFDSLVVAFRERHSKSLGEIFQVFKKNVQRAVENIKRNLHHIIENSIEAGLVNFLNNLLIFVINLVATTMKNIITIIRCGFTTVWNATKLMLSPPPDMSTEERNEAVCKILIFGGVNIGIMALDEGIKKCLLTVGIPEQLTELLVYPLASCLGGVVASLILGVLTFARKGGKKSRLHVELIAQGNVVVQAQIVQNWCLLIEGKYYLKQETAKRQRQFSSIREAMERDANQTECVLDEVDTILKEIGR